VMGDEVQPEPTGPFGQPPRVDAVQQVVDGLPARGCRRREGRSTPAGWRRGTRRRGCRATRSSRPPAAPADAGRRAPYATRCSRPGPGSAFVPPSHPRCRNPAMNTCLPYPIPALPGVFTIRDH
jgi:hypothetical protein